MRAQCRGLGLAWWARAEIQSGRDPQCDEILWKRLGLGPTLSSNTSSACGLRQEERAQDGVRGCRGAGVEGGDRGAVARGLEAWRGPAFAADRSRGPREAVRVPRSLWCERLPQSRC